ncbi:MAG: mandelate racemase/muconate lactonizing enzyme family protein [Pseudomonadota bacterium]|nr:mandelate racemase/muconate lactonizing enzyme family protein [Pseudomonadota bacterium]
MNSPAPALPRVRKLVAHVLRWPVATPVRTSFGVMRDRPMVLVQAEDAGGISGWGEVWCNFPAVGAEHRARLVASVFAPAVVDADLGTPGAAFERLTRMSAVLAIQAGEPGPIAQCIAGIDMALWDLAARRAGQPLWRLLGGTDPAVNVYASGINPDAPEKIALERRDEGYTAFKLKVGFGAERDLANLRTMRDALGAGARLMVDANQAWTLEEAQRMAPRLAEFGLDWLEEPMRADSPYADWKALAAASPVTLAAGENIAGEGAFDEALAARVFGIVQPDMAKWGGFSGCLPVARRILAAGVRFCPHYLGGGVGLLASAHLLAAAGGGGMLEVDANPNPLRTRACGPLARVADGRSRLDDSPGLGIEPDLDALHSLCR